MPEVSIKVGLNSAQVRTGAAEVKAQLDQMKKHGEAAHHSVNGGHGTSHHRFGSMVGEMRAERQLGGLGQNLSSARSGSEALAMSLEKVGRVFHLGLAIGVGAHLAGYFIEQGEKVHEQTEKTISDFETLAATGRDKLDFGTVGDKIKFGDQMAEQMDKLEAQNSRLGKFTPSTIAQVWSGTYGDDVQALAKARGEAQALRAEARQATLEDFAKQVEIAEMKLAGQHEEVAELERVRKLNLEILRINQSQLDTYAKKKAIEALTMLSENVGDVKDADAQRAQRAKDEAAINETLEKRKTLGENEEQHMARLLSEITAHAEAVRRSEAQAPMAAKHAAYLKGELDAASKNSDRYAGQENSPAARTAAAIKKDALNAYAEKTRLAERIAAEGISHRAAMEKGITEVKGIQIKTAEKYEKEAAARQDRIWTKEQQIADKKRRNAMEGMTDEQKISALLKQRAELNAEHLKAAKAGNVEAMRDIESKTLDINKEMDDAAKRAPKERPSVVASDLARKGLGGAVYFAKEQDPAKRAAKTAEDALKVHQRSETLLTEIRDKKPAWGS